MTAILAFLAALLVFGSLGFWIFSFLVFVAITALVENDEGFWATVVAIGTVCSLQFLSHIPLLTAIKAHPGTTALYLLGYFVAGAAWSIFKWYIFLTKARIKYESAKADFLEEYSAKELTGELAAKFMDLLASNHSYSDDDHAISATPPEARKHKSNLTRWATYWPFSMVGFALNDVVRKAWNYIYDLLQSTYQRISNHVFRNVSADAAMAKEYKARAAAAGSSTTSETTSRRGYRDN